MAISIEELLSGQKRLLESTQNVERINLEQLKNMKAPASSVPPSDTFEKLNSNIVKLVDAVKKNTIALTTLTNKKETNTSNIQKPSMKNAETSEADIEQQNFNNKMYDIFEKIEENTRNKADDKKEDKNKPNFLAGWGTILAVALGTVAGIFKGWLSAIKIVFSGIIGIFRGFYKGLIALSDLKFFSGLKKVLFNIEMTLAWTAESIKGVFNKFISKIVTIFDDTAKILKALWASLTESKVFKALSSAFSRLVSFIKPLAELIENITKTGFSKIIEYFKPIGSFFDDMAKGSSTISNIVKGISSKTSSFMSFFDDIGKWFSSFGKVFGSVAKIVSKLAAPVLVIMTIWDTVKGAIAGFEENGIIGGIAGAIEGLINSLIMAPLDMLKSAVSWIAGAFGFEEAEKFLDSFSFADMFSELMDMVQKPFNMIKDIFGKVGEWFKNLQIPAIGFEAFGKKVEFGPWKPFADETSTATAKPAAPISSNTAAIAPIGNVKPTSSAEAVTKGSRQAADANKPVAIGATNVVSAPTTITKQTKNVMVKQQTRNPEGSINSYFKSRYA